MPHVLDSVNRLVVRLPTWVGDAVMATPALRAIRRRFPGAHVSLQGRAHLEALLEGANLFDSYLPLGRGSGAASDHSVNQLREFGPDLAVVLPHSLRAALDVFRARVPFRLGYAREGRRWLLTHSLIPHRGTAMAGGRRGNLRAGAGVPRGRRGDETEPGSVAGRRRRFKGGIAPVPMIMQYLELVAAVGARDDDLGPVLGIPAEVREASRRDLARRGVQSGDRLLAINPGASFGPSKVYPVDLLARAAGEIASRCGLRPFILCGPGEEELATDLARRLGPAAIDTSQQVLPLDHLKAAIARAVLMLTTDTGPWHIGNSLGTPSVVLMGPTDPRFTASHQRASVVLREEVPCGPCHLKVCPFSHHACMTRIDPERVVAAGIGLLRGG